MELKGYRYQGCLIVAENETEALQMYKDKYGDVLYEDKIKEENLDNWFCYFNIEDIDPEDYEHIYDRKNIDGKQEVSLKRPYAKKYGKCLFDKKVIDLIIY